MPQEGETKLLWTLTGYRPAIWLPCEECKQYFWAIKGFEQVCRVCFTKVGAKRVGSGGYIWIKLAEDNPYYSMTREWWRFGYGWVQEHRYIMAKHLERCLEEEERVYRLNKDKTDNCIENLSLKMPKTQRMQAFRAMRAKQARNGQLI